MLGALSAVLLVQLVDYAYEDEVEFVSYFTAAEVLRDGGGAAVLYDDPAFNEEIDIRGYAGHQVYYPNPPSTAFFVMPLTIFTIQVARIIWLAMSVSFLSIAVILLLRDLGYGTTASLCFVLLTLVYQPIRADLHNGQLYALGLLLLVLTLRALRRQQPAYTGASCAGLLMLKLFSPLVCLWLAIERDWRALKFAFVVLVLFVFLSWPIIQQDGWVAFTQVPFKVANDRALSVTAFQSIPGTIRHLLSYDPIWNPVPILRLEYGINAIIWTAGIAMTLVTLWATRKSQNIDLSFALVISASIMLSPFSQDYTYTLLLLPIGVISVRLWPLPWSPLLIFALLATGLVASPIWYKTPIYSKGALALLAYPKLYGCLVIWSILLFLIIRPGGSTSTAQ